MNIHELSIWQACGNREVDIFHMPSCTNPSDMMTKEDKDDLHYVSIRNIVVLPRPDGGCQGLALDPLSDVKARAKEPASEIGATSLESEKSSSGSDIANLDTNAMVNDESDGDGVDLETKKKVEDDWILVESRRRSRNKRSGG